MGRPGFYSRSMKSWLHSNDIETYLKHNKGKSVLAERVMIVNIYEHKSVVSKMFTLINRNIWLTNTTTHISDMYTNCGVEHNKKIPTSRLMIIWENKNTKIFL